MQIFKIILVRIYFLSILIDLHLELLSKFKALLLFLEFLDHLSILVFQLAVLVFELLILLRRYAPTVSASVGFHVSHLLLQGLEAG